MRTFLAAPIAMAMLALSLSLPAQVPAGSYEGHITYKDYPMQVMVHLWDASDGGRRGALDIPAQQEKGRQLLDITTQGDSLHFRVWSHLSEFRFRLRHQGGKLTGEVRRGGYAYPLEASRTGDAGPAEYPSPSDASYSSEEVKFTHSGYDFAGTLTLPTGPGPHAAVVLISGSGAQERDSDVLGFKVFATLSHMLSQQGFAVLRFDDRGTGQSHAPHVMASTTADVALDVEAAVAMLKSRPDIDARRIGLMGHSEGGIVAPMVAARNPAIAFIVLMAGTGVQGSVLMQEQRKLLGKASGVSAEQMAENEKLVETLMREAKDPKYRPKAEKQFRKELKKMAPAKRSQIVDDAEWVHSRIQEHFQGINLPWMQFFLEYDPSAALRQVHCPVLLLFGEKDLQVPPALNEGPMLDALEAAGNERVKSVLIPDANHLFQEAKTGAVSEYASLPKDFAPEFKEELAAWMAQWK